jgi:hypothetical protein
MEIALLYAAWDGEGWSTPIGFHRELETRGHTIRHYNLYHDQGALNPRDNMRHYSAQCLNDMMIDWRDRGYRPDVVYVMDYGQFDCPAQDKQHFPGSIWLMEAGDEPQTFRMNALKARKFHTVLSPDKSCVDLYHQGGIDAEWHTHHADHRLFYPRPEIVEEFDCITTCGPRGAGLTEEIAEALGDRFMNHRYYYGEAHAERLSMGKMVFQCSQFKEVTRRIFEGMACGKMVITDKLPEHTGLSDLFEDGQDIVYYDTAQDAIDKIRYYAEHEDERLEIAKRGYEKVMKYHTVASRVDQFEATVTRLSQSVLAK